MLFTYRLLTSLDAEIFREICLCAVKEVPEAFQETYEELSKASALDFTSCFRHGWIIGAFSASVLQGIAGLSMHKRRKGMLWGLYVNPSFRGYGFGGQMIEGLLIKAKKASIERVFLSVRSENSHALTLYKKLGFIPCEVEGSSLADGGGLSCEILMGKNI